MTTHALGRPVEPEVKYTWLTRWGSSGGRGCAGGGEVDAFCKLERENVGGSGGVEESKMVDEEMRRDGFAEDRRSERRAGGSRGSRGRRAMRARRTPARVVVSSS